MGTCHCQQSQKSISTQLIQKRMYSSNKDTAFKVKPEFKEIRPREESVDETVVNLDEHSRHHHRKLHQKQTSRSLRKKRFQDMINEYQKDVLLYQKVIEKQKKLQKQYKQKQQSNDPDERKLIPSDREKRLREYTERRKKADLYMSFRSYKVIDQSNYSSFAKSGDSYKEGERCQSMKKGILKSKSVQRKKSVKTECGSRRKVQFNMD